MWHDDCDIWTDVKSSYGNDSYGNEYIRALDEKQRKNLNTEVTEFKTGLIVLIKDLLKNKG